MIVEADAVVKGQTASSSYKPAILDNGVRVMVPPHIGAGTQIVVDVYEQTYRRGAPIESCSSLPGRVGGGWSRQEFRSFAGSTSSDTHLGPSCKRGGGD